MANKRGLHGFKEREIMKRAGVSRSTIQRYKGVKGTVGGLSSAMLQRVESAILEGLSEKLSERQIALDKYFADEGIGETAWHREVAKQLGKGVFDPTDKSTAEIERGIAMADKLLNAQTSTPEGVDKWRKNTRIAAEKTFGLSGDRLDSALDAFNNAMEDPTTRRYIEANYGNGIGKKMSSWQKVEAIQKIFSDRRYKGDYGRITEQLRKRAQKWYNKNFNDEE